MAVKIMAYVWEHSKQEKTKLLLMLAIADNADNTGFAFPGQESLAAKCRCTERYVQKMIADLEVDGELIVYPNMGIRTKFGRTHLYKIVVPGVNDDADPSSPVIQYEKPKDTSPRRRTAGHKRTKSKTNPGSDTSQKARRTIVRVGLKARRTPVRPAMQSETNPGSGNPSVKENPSVIKQPPEKTLSPTDGDDDKPSIFDLYASAETPESPAAVKDSSMGTEDSFRLSDPQGDPEGQGPDFHSRTESLREVGETSGGPDLPGPARAAGSDDSSTPDTETPVPEFGSAVEDTHAYRKEYVGRWPAFARMPDASKWPQISRMIDFLFSGKGAKKKWAVPFEKPLSLVELYAFNTWMRAQHRQVWEKISSFETVAKYVDWFRHDTRYLQEMRSADMILVAHQHSEPYEPIEDNTPLALAAITEVLGDAWTDLVKSKTWDPNAQYIIPAYKGTHDDQSANAT